MSTGRMHPLPKRPIGFFVHHQGRGHAHRCQAIIEHLGDRPVTIFTADPGNFGPLPENAEIVVIPDMIGRPSATKALHDQETPSIMHCVPLGVPEARETFGIVARWMLEADPVLFVSDVSAEMAQLSRLLSVPCVKIRMHGDRSDPGHIGAYEACVGLLAPFSKEMEQEDFPARLEAKTFYAGGLCTTTDPVPTKEEARARLGFDAGTRIILVMSGGGGSGAPFAPLTMAARAIPDARWIVVGPVHREGHETEFANLEEHGWVDDPLSYIAAADVVVASAGDNTVHEIARVGRPFVCVPEWRYFDEQRHKAACLARLGAAVSLEGWPASTAQWLAAVASAQALDVTSQTELFDTQAALNAATWLRSLVEDLWIEDAPLVAAGAVRA